MDQGAETFYRGVRSLPAFDLRRCSKQRAHLPAPGPISFALCFCSVFKGLLAGCSGSFYKSLFFSPLGGANNPFLQNASYAADGSRIEGDPAQGQYYGAGYSQAQSGYSSSGFGK